MFSLFYVISLICTVQPNKQTKMLKNLAASLPQRCLIQFFFLYYVLCIMFYQMEII